MSEKKISLILLLLIGVCFLNSCFFNKYRKYKTLKVNIIDNESYWNNVSPIMFIDTLIAHPQEVFIIKPIEKEDWYDQKYIVELEKKSNDNRVCGGVLSIYASESFLYEYTNVSNQVENLIDGIKNKKYPAILVSNYR